MDLSLTEVPLLEVVSLVLLVCWVDSGNENHQLCQLVLSETLVDKQVVALVDGSVAALAGSGKHLETSAETKGKCKY